uniref:Uncharacterized protein n=1 Tax=Molossus molossus TaxID=27622 RepID=A0A7J8CRU8_MOLMO|nr:hypothetical protein HJG59_009770 [Molossus molossus]
MPSAGGGTLPIWPGGRTDLSLRSLHPETLTLLPPSQNNWFLTSSEGSKLLPESLSFLHGFCPLENGIHSSFSFISSFHFSERFSWILNSTRPCYTVNNFILSLKEIRFSQPPPRDIPYSNF